MTKILKTNCTITNNYRNNIPTNRTISDTRCIHLLACKISPTGLLYKRNTSGQFRLWRNWRSADNGQVVSSPVDKNPLLMHLSSSIMTYGGQYPHRIHL